MSDIKNQQQSLQKLINIVGKQHVLTDDGTLDYIVRGDVMVRARFLQL